MLRGRNIKRYKAEFADLWLINTHNGYVNSEGERIPPININDYPAIKEYLDQYWNKLKKRQDKGKTPYNLRNCAYLEEFEKEKIIYNDISQYLAFSFCEKGVYFNNTVYFITNSIYNLYLTSILNTKLIDWYYKRISAQLGEKAVRLFSIYVQNIPIPKISKQEQKPFEILVDYIITLKAQNKGSESHFFEAVIDTMVYELYFEQEVKKAGKEILKHLSDLKPITDDTLSDNRRMSDEEKLAIIQSEFERLYEPNHPVRFALETIDSIEEVRIIKEALR